MQIQHFYKNTRMCILGMFRTSRRWAY